MNPVHTAEAQMPEVDTLMGDSIASCATPTNEGPLKELNDFKDYLMELLCDESNSREIQLSYESEESQPKPVESFDATETENFYASTTRMAAELLREQRSKQ